MVGRNVPHSLDVLAAHSRLGSHDLSRCPRLVAWYRRTLYFLALAKSTNMGQSRHCWSLSQSPAAHKNDMDHRLPDLVTHLWYLAVFETRAGSGNQRPLLWTVRAGRVCEDSYQPSP